MPRQSVTPKICDVIEALNDKNHECRRSSFSHFISENCFSLFTLSLFIPHQVLIGNSHLDISFPAMAKEKYCFRHFISRNRERETLVEDLSCRNGKTEMSVKYSNGRNLKKTIPSAYFIHQACKTQRHENRNFKCKMKSKHLNLKVKIQIPT